MLICSFYFLQFVITSDLRCIYNNHINGRLQDDFGNVNGVNKDIGQEVNTYLCLPSTIRLYCWNWFCDPNMVSRILLYICLITCVAHWFICIASAIHLGEEFRLLRADIVQKFVLSCLPFIPEQLWQGLQYCRSVHTRGLYDNFIMNWSPRNLTSIWDMCNFFCGKIYVINVFVWAEPAIACHPCL